MPASEEGDCIIGDTTNVVDGPWTFEQRQLALIHHATFLLEQFKQYPQGRALLRHYAKSVDDEEAARALSK